MPVIIREHSEPNSQAAAAYLMYNLRDERKVLLQGAPTLATLALPYLFLNVVCSG